MAAQMLAGQGFEQVYNLSGGIKAWQGEKAAGPEEMGIVLLRGDETAADILVLAYGMEEGLQSFYLAMLARTDVNAITNTLITLANIENTHKTKLFKLYQQFDPAISNDRTAFETHVMSTVMEGGFTTEEFLEHYASVLNTVQEVLDLAMMLEAQALDLYLRYADRIENSKSQNVLFTIAEEEKAHLKTLGQLKEKTIAT